ncbi:MAG: hypothetical protein JWN84_2875 [Nocardioides sp.]|nr:hypothetical protein [Nocardioides sp.]
MDPDAQPPNYDAFWSWWLEQGAAACEAGIADGTLSELVDEITARVHAISPELVWELGPGSSAQHLLVVSPEGNPDVRAAAHRWLLAAPAPTETWEYADARPPSGDPDSGGMRVGETDVDFAAIRVGATRVGNHVDVAVHHPALRELPEQARGAIAFLSLDHALGETDCETWVGNVGIALDPPPDAVTLEDLRGLVTQVARDAVGDDGQPVWVLLQGEHDGAPLMAAAQVPLASSWAPHLDTHLEIDVPYADATPDGLPAPEALDALRGLEDHLADRLAGTARLVAHETGRGRRLLHVYADSETPAAAVVEAAVTGWEQGRVEVRATPDPSWHGVRHLRT